MEHHVISTLFRDEGKPPEMMLKIAELGTEEPPFES
jgi:hypothetical protein